MTILLLSSPPLPHHHFRLSIMTLSSFPIFAFPLDDETLCLDSFGGKTDLIDRFVSARRSQMDRIYIYISYETYTYVAIPLTSGGSTDVLLTPCENMCRRKLTFSLLRVSLDRPTTGNKIRWEFTQPDLFYSFPIA